MYSLVMKDLKLGVNPIFFVLPFLTGALMLIPGWIYFLVILYFCWLTVPNMFAGYKTHNDLMFMSMMPVTKKDIVKARVSVIVLLELMHIVIAILFGMITIRLYPNLTYFFFSPSVGFWGLCFAMLAIYNITLISMYYKTAYKYGGAAFVSATAAMLFAGGAQWLGIQNSYVYDLFNGTGGDHVAAQTIILIAGIVLFVVFTLIAYQIAIRRFLKVEIQ